MNQIIAERLKALGCHRIAEAIHRAQAIVNRHPVRTAPGKIVGGLVVTEAPSLSFVSRLARFSSGILYDEASENVHSSLEEHV